jgi:3-deoxy-7-phosphoheptulonate synthase
MNSLVVVRQGDADVVQRQLHAQWAVSAWIVSPTLIVAHAGAARLAELLVHPGVHAVHEIATEYPLAARVEGVREATTVRVGSARVGVGITVIAGPCAVDSREDLCATADVVRDSGAHALRGGAFKPRTSPYAFQGLGAEGLRYLAEARRRTGLPVVTEVLDPRHVAAVAEVADVLQIGARNMQNFALLREAGRTMLPVLLKRGLSATVDEFLLAAEYVLAEGNSHVILCERGIRAVENGCRFSLDVGIIPVLKERSHLPVIADPSHAAGNFTRVVPLALAAVAGGADGVIIETHHDPARSRCDAAQALPVSLLPDLIRRLRLIGQALGDVVWEAPSPGLVVAV